MFKNEKIEWLMNQIVYWIFTITTDVFDRLGIMIFLILSYTVIVVASPFLLLYALINNIIKTYKEKLSIEDLF